MRSPGHVISRCAERILTVGNRRPRESEGIVTLCDSSYFPGLVLLARSVAMNYPVPITCFDSGLESDQKQWLRENMPAVEVRPIPNLDLITAIRRQCGSAAKWKPGKRVWPVWICPLLIQASPYQRVFWLDSDVAVLRGLAKLFSFLDAGPVFTTRNSSPHRPNGPMLYEKLPIGEHAHLEEPKVNGGVSGWDLQRDREILASYIYPMERGFLHDPSILDHITSNDQGCLMWAIYRHGAHDRILEDRRWNRSVHDTKATTFRVSNDPNEITDKDIRQLRKIASSTSVLHWNGCPNPWTVVTTEAA